MSFTGAADEEVHIMLKGLRPAAAGADRGGRQCGSAVARRLTGGVSRSIAVTATDTDDKKLFKMANRGTHIAGGAPGSTFSPRADGGYQITPAHRSAAAQSERSRAVILDRNRRHRRGRRPPLLMSTRRDWPTGHDDQFGSGLVDALGASCRRPRRSSDRSGRVRGRRLA